MNPLIKKIFFTPVILFLAFTLFSCNNDDDVEPNFAQGSNEAINNWIYDQLEIYYYWEDQLPAKENSNLNPEDYFSSLIYSQEDRFSWIQPNFQELLNSLQGVSKEAGYEFTLYNDGAVPDGVLGQISYIKKGSPASEEDIKRGDIFTEINGTRLTIANYQSLLSGIRANHTINIIRYNDATETFDEIGSRDLMAIEFAENPNFLDTVYAINEKKIGYYVYNFFATGSTSSDSSYINEMDQIFQMFQNQGIQHLIVDLRYNSGGAESATINLASLIGSNISSGDIFVKRDFNDFLTEVYRERDESILIKNFKGKSANIGAQLENQSVVILTSSRSASASELLINGLLPYMDVFLIGETTVGKNVGSFSLFDNEDTENNWGMQPIVTKSFNSRDESDYSTGFIPNIELRDNNLIKKELGDVHELLLASAIQHLTGVVARQAQQLPQKIANDIYSSLEAKRSFGIYTIELPKSEL
jgi:C-terminal processing protease CtpA/Prc